MVWTIFSLEHTAQLDGAGMTREHLFYWARLVNNLDALFRDNNREGSVKKLGCGSRGPIAGDAYGARLPAREGISMERIRN